MKRLSVIGKRTIAFVLSALLVMGGLFCAPMFVRASAAFSMTASEVSNGAFTVTITGPDVSWAALTFDVSYDSSKVQLSSAPQYSGPSLMMFYTTYNDGYSGSSVTISGFATANVSGSAKVTLPFKVVNADATSVAVSMSITTFGDSSSTPIGANAPAPLNITLKTPSSSTDGGGSGSTSSTTDDTPVSTSTTTNTTTDTNTTTTKTDTNTTTTKTDTNTTTKTNSITKTSGTVESSTTSDTGTEPDVTDSEELTDTETNFPISDSNSETDVSMSETDDTDTTSDQSSSVVSTVTSSTQEAPKKEISTGMIALISVGVSVVICGALTVVGLLRHKKEQE